MDEISADDPPDRPIIVAAVLEQDRWALEALRQNREAERWQRRVSLAERHQEFDLASEAAHRARVHAGLALVAAGRHAKQQALVQRLTQASPASAPSTDVLSPLVTIMSIPVDKQESRMIGATGDL